MLAIYLLQALFSESLWIICSVFDEVAIRRQLRDPDEILLILPTIQNKTPAPGIPCRFRWGCRSYEESALRILHTVYARLCSKKSGFNVLPCSNGQGCSSMFIERAKLHE